VQDDLVGDGLHGGCVGGASVVAVGAAAFALAGGCPARSQRGEVAGFAQLGEQVAQGYSQAPRGERAARVAESRAASMVRLKLIRLGSRPGGAAWVIRWRTAW
jgi:hypothetical protein